MTTFEPAVCVITQDNKQQREPVVSVATQQSSVVLGSVYRANIPRPPLESWLMSFVFRFVRAL